jgi:predicted membrane-bound mannosyltransferase
MALTTLVAVVSLTLEFFDPTLPTINSNGIIFWHMQPIGAWATAAISLITGIAWGVIFLNSSQYVTDAYSRLKAYVLAADGMTWGLAAFLYFPSYNQVQTLTSFFLMVVSLSVTAVVFTLARLRGSRLSVPE